MTDISILGYSQGGGSVYNLSNWLDEQQFFDIDAFNLVFTTYVDAIVDNAALANAESRLPVGTQWHLNLYQTIGDILDGTNVVGANENIDVETSPLFPFDDITHFRIDDAPEVRDWVLMRFRQNVDR